MNSMEPEHSGQEDYLDCIQPGLAIIFQAMVRRMCDEDYCSNWRDNMDKRDGLERFYHSIFDSVELELAEPGSDLNSYCRFIDAYLTVLGSLQIISSACRELGHRTEDQSLQSSCKDAADYIQAVIGRQDPNIRKTSTYGFRDLEMYGVG